MTPAMPPQFGFAAKQSSRRLNGRDNVTVNIANTVTHDVASLKGKQAV